MKSTKEPGAHAHAEVFDLVLAQLHNKFTEADFPVVLHMVYKY